MTAGRATRRPRRSHRRSGFTIIEVVISLGIMTVAAMAVVALQQHNIRSNSHARQLATATQIAQRWVERLKQDAARWNQAAVAGGTPTAATVLGPTDYLEAVVTLPNVFQLIPNATQAVSNAFDYQGEDTLNTSPNVHYCASFRPGWVSFGRALRVDVRVWWARSDVQHSDAFQGLATDFPGCNDTGNLGLDPGGTLLDDYHVVYMPMVIRMVPVEI